MGVEMTPDAAAAVLAAPKPVAAVLAELCAHGWTAETIPGTPFQPLSHQLCRATEGGHFVARVTALRAADYMQQWTFHYWVSTDHGRVLVVPARGLYIPARTATEAAANAWTLARSAAAHRCTAIPAEAAEAWADPAVWRRWLAERIPRSHEIPAVRRAFAYQVDRPEWAYPVTLYRRRTGDLGDARHLRKGLVAARSYLAAVGVAVAEPRR